MAKKTRMVSSEILFQFLKLLKDLIIIIEFDHPFRLGQVGVRIEALIQSL
jgi:hypothetical protein